MTIKPLEDLKAYVNWCRQIRRDNGNAIQITDFIDQIVLEGYIYLHTEQAGAAKHYLLKNKEGTMYTFRRKVEAEYISRSPGVIIVPEASIITIPNKTRMPTGKFIALDDMQVIREASRGDVVYSILQQPQLYPIPNIDKYKYLIGCTRFGSVIALVWEERTLDLNIAGLIYKERNRAGFKGKVRVYGRTAVTWSNTLEFYQLPLTHCQEPHG